MSTLYLTGKVISCSTKHVLKVGRRLDLSEQFVQTASYGFGTADLHILIIINGLFEFYIHKQFTISFPATNKTHFSYPDKEWTWLPKTYLLSLVIYRHIFWKHIMRCEVKGKYFFIDKILQSIPNFICMRLFKYFMDSQNIFIYFNQLFSLVVQS